MCVYMHVSISVSVATCPVKEQFVKWLQVLRLQLQGRLDADVSSALPSFPVSSSLSLNCQPDTQGVPSIHCSKHPHLSESMSYLVSLYPVCIYKMWWGMETTIDRSLLVPE